MQPTLVYDDYYVTVNEMYEQGKPIVIFALFIALYSNMRWGKKNRMKYKKWDYIRKKQRKNVKRRRK